MTDCGGIFCIYSGFVKYCFSMTSAYAYEVELQVVLHAVEFAQKFHWDFLWLECDGIYVV